MTRDLVNFIYELYHEDSEFRRKVESYHRDTKSTLILTVYTKEKAREEVEKFKHIIRDKVVLELGAGIGILAMEMAKYAKFVVAIEKDPAWSWIFVRNHLYEKPRNLIFVFGDAEEFLKLFDSFRPDVVVIYSKSAIDHFIIMALAFRPKAIVLNGKLIFEEE